ncbi:MAG: response regulator [Deltaproteobacteria bacterium]|nr:response regulator [Deltaproteobacteria bacterium]
MKEKKILIVDDEEAIRQLFKTALSHKGYTVFSAGSGEKALAILEKETIPVMFLDLNLPGMSGIELCKKILKKAPGTLTYAITGYNSNYKSLECRKAGFEGYFSKPVPLQTLFETALNAFKKF